MGKPGATAQIVAQTIYRQKRKVPTRKKRRKKIRFLLSIISLLPPSSLALHHSLFFSSPHSPARLLAVVSFIFLKKVCAQEHHFLRCSFSGTLSLKCVCSVNLSSIIHQASQNKGEGCGSVSGCDEVMEGGCMCGRRWSTV